MKINPHFISKINAILNISTNSNISLENLDTSKENYFDKSINETINDSFVNIDSLENTLLANADLNNFSKLSENHEESSLFNTETKFLNTNEDNNLNISLTKENNLVVETKELQIDTDQLNFNTAETVEEQNKEPATNTLDNDELE